MRTSWHVLPVGSRGLDTKQGVDAATAFEPVLARNLRLSGQECYWSWTPAMVIFLDHYRKAQATKRVGAANRYDEELLCVNWNPAVSLIALSYFQTEQELSPQLPEDFSTIDAGVFLDRVYALAGQI